MVVRSVISCMTELHRIGAHWKQDKECPDFLFHLFALDQKSSFSLHLRQWPLSCFCHRVFCSPLAPPLPVDMPMMKICCCNQVSEAKSIYRFCVLCQRWHHCELIRSSRLQFFWWHECATNSEDDDIIATVYSPEHYTRTYNLPHIFHASMYKIYGIFPPPEIEQKEWWQGIS